MKTKFHQQKKRAAVDNSQEITKKARVLTATEATNTSTTEATLVSTAKVTTTAQEVFFQNHQ